MFCSESWLHYIPSVLFIVWRNRKIWQWIVTFANRVLITCTWPFFCNRLVMGHTKITIWTHFLFSDFPLFAFWSHFFCEALMQLKLGQNRFSVSSTTFFREKNPQMKPKIFQEIEISEIGYWGFRSLLNTNVATKNSLYTQFQGQWAKLKFSWNLSLKPPILYRRVFSLPSRL